MTWKDQPEKYRAAVEACICYMRAFPCPTDEQLQARGEEADKKKEEDFKRDYEAKIAWREEAAKKMEEEREMC